MKALLWLLFAVLCAPVEAANLSVTPTRLVLSETTNTATLTFTNHSQQPMSLQIFMKAWDQDENGQSLLTDSREVVVFPKMLVIEPGQARPVRLGFQGQWPAHEATFRIFADELPRINIQTGSTGVVFPVRISIPVFVRKQADVPEPNLVIAGAELRAGGLRVSIQNAGQHSFAVSPVTATLFDGKDQTIGVLEDKGWHVLAEHVVHFRMPLDKALCGRVRAVSIRAQADAVVKTQRYPLPVQECQSDQ